MLFISTRARNCKSPATNKNMFKVEWNKIISHVAEFEGTPPCALFDLFFGWDRPYLIAYESKVTVPVNIGLVLAEMLMIRRGFPGVFTSATSQTVILSWLITLPHATSAAIAPPCFAVHYWNSLLLISTQKGHSSSSKVWIVDGSWASRVVVGGQLPTAGWFCFKNVEK